MERIGKSAPYNFKMIFGFTDSTFLTDVGSTERSKQFIAECKERLGVTVELKNIFKNMIVIAHKNRYLAWSGKEEDDPIYRGFEGLSSAAPKWLRRWFEKIAFEIIKQPNTQAEKVPEMISEAFAELQSGRLNAVEELSFSRKMSMDLKDYCDTWEIGLDLVEYIQRRILKKLVQVHPSRESLTLNS
jgi:DNA polymerase elongation subunit (family B)